MSENFQHSSNSASIQHPNSLSLRRSGGGGGASGSGSGGIGMASSGTVSAPSTAPILSIACPFMQPFGGGSSSKHSPEIDPFNRNETQKKVSLFL